MKEDISREQDLELLQQVQMGNEQAFELLMKKYYKNLYHYAAKFCSDKETVKDCVQESFLSLWQRKEKAGKILSLKYYLLLSVKNQVLNAVHRTHRSFPLYEDGGNYPFMIEFAIDKVQADQQLIKDNAMRIQKVIAQLSSRQKEIIHLKFYEQLDHGQISGLLSISHQSVYNLLHESIKKIRQVWQAEYGGKISLLSMFALLCSN